MINIKYKFFDNTDLDDIKKKVFSLREHWFSPKGSPTDSPVQINFLPLGLYTVPYTDIRLYNHSGRIRNIMIDNFGPYYEKIMLEVSELFNKPVVYCDHLSVPGFHIFTYKDSGGPNKLNMHKDEFSFDNFISSGDIFSITIPIHLPVSGSGIYYKNNDKIEHIKYEVGCFGIWDGNIEHSIDDFVLQNENDFRLTIQCHVSVQKDKIYMFW